VTVDERLRAAAEKWAQLDHAATWGPWNVHESWAGKCAVVTDGGHPIAIVSHGEPSDTAKADADLIATLRPLAAVTAAYLQKQAQAYAMQVRPDPHREYVHEGGCCRPRRYLSDGTVGCTCFDDALALADVILGPVTA
jgi:hypothetical protein